jgi:hypothetical protein
MTTQSDEPLPEHPTVFEMQQFIAQSLNGGKVPTTKTKTKTPADIIKEMCGMLQSFGFNYLFAEFDGSGDSGDFDAITLMPKHPDSGARDSLDAAVNEEHQKSFHAFRHETLDNARTSTQQATLIKQLDEFEEALWQILPSGWEINEGSFGELHVDIANRKIHLVVNERISEVHTYERDF